MRSVVPVARHSGDHVGDPVRIRWTAQAVACMFAVLSAPGGAPAAEPDGSSASAVVASPDADERLYLVRCVEYLYEGWPDDVSDPEEFVRAAADLRGRALRLRQHVRDEGLDEALGWMFDDFIAALDAYLGFLGRIDAIEAEAAIRASEDAFGSGFKGGYAGGITYSGMKHQDASSGEAAAAALVIGLATTAFDSWRKAEARDRAKAEAVADEARRVDDQVRTALYRAQSLSRSLAERYGWEAGEVGFELDAGRLGRIRAMIARNDTTGLRLLTEAEASKRPRDPSARLAAAVFEPFGPPATGQSAPSPDAALRVSDAVLRCASLVPKHHVYDVDRSLYCGVAAAFATAARLIELDAGLPFGDETPASRAAVRLWRLALAYDSTDATGDVRAGLAQALYCDGRAAEAVAAASEVAALRGADPDFCYVFACILSASGETATAMSWLEAAVSRGKPDVAGMRADPQLTGVRAAEAARFRALTDVKWSWSAGWGVFNDDLKVTNGSPFPLTNVAFTYDLRQDGRSWKGTLKADRVEPGATHVWRNVVSVPGRRLTSSGAMLTCDQDGPAGDAPTADAPATGVASTGRPERPPARGSSPAGSMAGRTVRVRRPTYAIDAGEKAAFLREGETYSILAEEDGGYVVEAGGRTGWVAGSDVAVLGPVGEKEGAASDATPQGPARSVGHGIARPHSATGVTTEPARREDPPPSDQPPRDAGGDAGRPSAADSMPRADVSVSAADGRASLLSAAPADRQVEPPPGPGGRSSTAAWYTRRPWPMLAVLIFCGLCRFLFCGRGDSSAPEPPPKD